MESANNMMADMAIRFFRCAAAVMSVFLMLATTPVEAQDVGQRYAVLIGGLGGSGDYTEKFQNYLFEGHKAFVEHLQFPPEQVIVLAETKLADLDFVTDVSTSENIRSYFADLATKVTADDHVYILLFGHGSYDGERAQLNIPRRDLSDADYAELVDALPAGRIVFVNTASASAPFIEVLSGPERIVITATRTGTQRNETVFPGFFVEGLASAAADMDKNSDLSVLEVFRYASEKAAQSFAETNHLPTEHALLDDTGDAKGHRVNELEEAAEGNLAAITFLKRGTTAMLATNGVNAGAVSQLLRDKEDIEREVAALKSRKNQLAEDIYYAELEVLFVRLARLNDTIEAGQ